MGGGTIVLEKTVWYNFLNRELRGAYTMKKKVNIFCLLGMVSGITSAIFYTKMPFLPPLALILGIMGLKKFDQELEVGKGMGLIAIIFGLIYCSEIVISYYRF